MIVNGRRAEKRFSRIWGSLLMLVFALSGCRSTPEPVVAKKAVQLSEAPALAPMPNYCAEQTGWNTNAVIAIFSNPKETAALFLPECAIKKALQQRGYRVADGFKSDTDWFAAQQRRQTKLVVVTALRTWRSAVFDGKFTADICMQVLVIEHPFDGVNLGLAVPHIRTFQVWSRAPHSSSLKSWDDAYSIHAPILAENLMKMPNFRAALEPSSSLAGTLCLKSKEVPFMQNTAARSTAVNTLTAPPLASLSAVDPNRETAEKLVGTWEEHVITQLKMRLDGKEPTSSSSETFSKTTYRPDGKFSREIRIGNADPSAFEGTWQIRQGKLYTDTRLATAVGDHAVSCEYDLVWKGLDTVMFRMTPVGYQGVLKTGGGSSVGRCWYDPEDVLHSTITSGNFSVESTSKLEPAKRASP